MKRFFNSLLPLSLLLVGCTSQPAVDAVSESQFVTVQGHDLIKPDGTKLFIQGTNLGNWLNPEGYMFGFGRTNCQWMINEVLCEMVGPDFTAEFWQQFKTNYITRQDIEFIAAQGANTIRLPFNYKLFTQEDYMGKTSNRETRIVDGEEELWCEGFTYIDSTLQWCRDNDLYLILDMHDCPGSQTGDNIDDGYGYPWLFESEPSQQLFCDIWQTIARHYQNEPTILGYELMNEPIAHYFENKEEINAKLEPLYKRAVAAIREVDKNHIVLLGGARWNSDFYMFQDWTFDDKIMYTCHRYGGEATAEAIKDYIDFRDKSGLPMYMGEFGHNTMQWQADMCQVLKDNNIGYTFWPYKKMGDSCMNGIVEPEGWRETVIKYSETPRGTFSEFREARPNQALARQLLMQFAENALFANCQPQTDYIESMSLR